MAKKSHKSKRKNQDVSRRQSAGEHGDRSQAESARGEEAQEGGWTAGLRRGVGTVGRGITGTGAKAVEAVTAHPVPAAMIGAGVAWLLVESLGRRTRIFERAGETLGRTFGKVGETLADAAGTVRDGIVGATGTVASSVRDGAGRLGEYAQTGFSAVGGAVRGGASAVGRGASLVGRGASQGYTYSKETLAETWEEHPLAVGVAVLAAGVAAGLLLPRTRREDEMMGEASDEVARQVRSQSEELVRRGKRAATAAVDATARAAKRAGLAPNQLKRKVKRIVTTAGDAAANAAAGAPAGGTASE